MHNSFKIVCLSDKSGSGLETCMANLEKDIASAKSSWVFNFANFANFQLFTTFFFITGKLWSTLWLQEHQSTSSQGYAVESVRDILQRGNYLQSSDCSADSCELKANDSETVCIR